MDNKPTHWGKRYSEGVCPPTGTVSISGTEKYSSFMAMVAIKQLGVSMLTVCFPFWNDVIRHFLSNLVLIGAIYLRLLSIGIFAMNNFLKNSFLTESENFNINNIVVCAVESLYSYIMLVTWRSSPKLNVKELNCVKNKGIGCFIHVVLAVPPRARAQLLAVSFGKFHSHNKHLGG